MKWRWCNYGRDRHPYGRAKAGRLITGESKFDPFVSEAAFLVDARRFDERKEVVARISGLLMGMPSESLEEAKSSNHPKQKTALDLLRLSTRSFCKCAFRFGRSTFLRVIARW
jgi:hypothetical protein